MAFDYDLLCKLSTGYSNVASSEYGYKNTDDTIAQITASGYFNNMTPAFTEGDTIDIEGSDGFVTVRVNSDTGVLPVTVTAPTESLPLLQARIFVGNSSNIAEGRAVSGDVTISETGVVTIADDAIDTQKIANLNVTASKVASLAVDALNPSIALVHRAVNTSGANNNKDIVFATNCIFLEALVAMSGNGTAGTQVAITNETTSQTLTIIDCSAANAGDVVRSLNRGTANAVSVGDTVRIAVTSTGGDAPLMNTFISFLPPTPV